MAFVLAAIALVTFLWLTRGPRKGGGVVPHTQAQREYAWRTKLDSMVGANSEQSLELQARGGVAKRKMLQAIRNIDARSEFQKRSRALGIRSDALQIVFRVGDGPLQLRAVPVVALRCIATPPADASRVTVVRRKLKLARYA